MPETPRDLITLPAAAVLLGSRDRRGRLPKRLIAEGRLPSYRLPGERLIKVRVKDVNCLIERARYYPVPVPKDVDNRDDDFTWAVKEAM